MPRESPTSGSELGCLARELDDWFSSVDSATAPMVLSDNMRRRHSSLVRLDGEIMFNYGLLIHVDLARLARRASKHRVANSHSFLGLS